jgi:hypothetical protein
MWLILIVVLVSALAWLYESGNNAVSIRNEVRPRLQPEDNQFGGGISRLLDG